MAFKTNQPAQMQGNNDYTVNPLFTVGESANNYTPLGIFDGIGAFKLNNTIVRVVVNHEVSEEDGYLYTLNSGTANEFQLSGTRISFFDINKSTLQIENAGLAYDQIFDLNGNLVTSTAQLPNSSGGTVGLDRFCSGQFFKAGTYGLVDDIYVTGEETSNGVGVILDVANSDLYMAAYLGRGAYENLTFLETGTDNFIASVWTDDTEGSLIYLWVGQKGVDFNANGDLDILERNGLSGAGYLYAWKPDSGDIDGKSFTTNGSNDVELTGAVDIRDRIVNNSYGNGSWVELTVRNESLAGQDVNGDNVIDYDQFGFALENTLRQEAYNKGALSWSRPEDIDTNPNNGSQFVVANTGRDTFAPIDGADLDGNGTPDPVSFDYVGDVMIGNTNFSALEGLNSYTEIVNGSLTTKFTLAYDGDQDPDRTLRSPDNLDWSTDGYIYVQEDRAVSGLWTGTGLDKITGTEAINKSESQIVRLDPLNGNPGDGGAIQVAQMNRSAVPSGQVDIEPDDVGNWESSGILDVSKLFDKGPGELYLFGVQAHSLSGGAIGNPDVENNDPTSDNSNLVQGGQLAFLETNNDITNFYRFRNTNYSTGTYLFVGEAERDAILTNPNLSNFELEGNGEPALKAATRAREGFTGFYRLRSVEVEGTYLSVGKEEYDFIFSDISGQKDKWVKEGFDTEGNDIPEYYAYGVGSNLSVPFNRFRNADNGTYLFTGPEETANILNTPSLSNAFINEGGAFEAFTA